MSVYYLDPDSDSKSDWTETPAGPAYACLNDGVRQPTAPGANWISSATNAQNNRQDFPNTITLKTDEIAKTVIGWWYIVNPAGRGCTLSLLASGTNIQSTVFPANTAGWVFCAGADLNQAQLDTLQLQAVSGAGTGAVVIHAEYIQVTTELRRAIGIVVETDSIPGSLGRSKSRDLQIAKEFEAPTSFRPYHEAILEDSPDLYWRLNETSGTTVYDSSGNDHHGKIKTGQVVSNAGHTLGQPGGTADGALALKMNGQWTLTPTVSQLYSGLGVTADDYKPFIPNSQRSFECWCYKIDPESFATMFSGDSGADDEGNNSAPHPTLEWGKVDGPGPNRTMVRWYSNVNSYPVKWIDWGDENDGSTWRNEFRLLEWNHVVFTYDDETSLAELWVNGRSQGQLGPFGYVLDVPIKYSTDFDPGNFQIGYRGGPPWFPNPGNSEVWGGLMQHVAVYTRILTPAEIERHYAIGRGVDPAPEAPTLSLTREAALSFATETDTVFPITPQKGYTLGIVNETNTVPGPLGRNKTRALPIVQETDEALNLWLPEPSVDDPTPRTVNEEHIVYSEFNQQNAWYVQAYHVPSRFMGTATEEDLAAARAAARAALQELLEAYWLPWDHAWNS